jgi:hypothetical protein
MMFHAFLMKKKLILSRPGALFPSQSQTAILISSIENIIFKLAKDVG